MARIRLQDQKKSETMPSAYYNVEPNWRSARGGPRPLQPRPYEEYVREKNKLNEMSSLLPPTHVCSKAATSSSSSKKSKSNSLSWSKKAKSDDDDDKASDTDEHDVHVELVSDIYR